jgi:hypothetical protein
MTLGRAELIYRDNFPVRLVFCGVLINFETVNPFLDCGFGLSTPVH